MKNNKNQKNNFRLIAIFFATIISLSFVGVVQATDPKLNIKDSSYVAEYVSQSIADPIVIEAGTTKWVKLNFKNIGTATWNNNGLNYISAYTVEPRYRDSVFFGANGWQSSGQVARMAGVIKSGETGEFGIPLHAPSQVGDYTEEFFLAAENYSWVEGGYFFLKIKVVPKTTATESAVDIVEDFDDDTVVTYESDRILQSKRSLTTGGGEKIKMTLGWQNKSGKSWQGYDLVVGDISIFLTGDENTSLYDESWDKSSVIISTESVVTALDSVRADFYFRTPEKKGNYEVTFLLKTGDKVVDKLVLPVVVTKDGTSVIVEVDPWLDYEPRIRVGLWQTDGLVQFGSTEDDYNVFVGTKKMGVLSKNDLATLKYNEGVYTFENGDLDFESIDFIRLEPKSNPHAVFELVNYSRAVFWKGGVNFNKYRGAMEYRMGEVNPDTWVINDLLFEDYMKGIAENSNGSPVEYLKAQSVAQRSYAYSVVQSDKYGIFDVVATTGDQLYLGFGSEAQLPNFVKGVIETRGYMVTYDNVVAITPYYAHSNGSTKSWTSVWGGSSKPWLVPVVCNYDNGRSQLGHGVGMSQLDAAARAEAEGLTWGELVEYYYTGVGIEKIYE